MAGTPIGDPVMVAARDRVLEMGGPTKANVFTKIQLALFGEYDWNGVPTMPVEIMLLPPPFFLFNIYEVSYWSRCVIVPLLIIMDRKPIKWLPSSQSLDELWPVPREQTSLRFPRVPEPFSWRGLFWKSVFIGVDDGLKIWERFSPRPLRKRAIDAARLWLEERLAVPGGLGGIYPGHGQLRARPARARLSGRPPADPGPAQGDRGPRGRARRRAPLSALPLAGVGHLAGGQRADRERSDAAIIPRCSARPTG